MDKNVKAPSGFHWMKVGKGFKLMKHKGKFEKHISDNELDFLKNLMDGMSKNKKFMTGR